MTATCLKTESELKIWLKDFQLTACKNYIGSVSFMKTFSAVAISMVAYNREIFPKRLFTVETYKGQKIPMLKSKTNCIQANLFYSWIIGFQDALEKQYLRSIDLSFYGDASKPETLMEKYNFSFMYNKGNILMSNTLSSNIRDATETFLKGCGKVVNEFDKLPEKYEMTMKLFYYDEDTPSDYEPPGFNACLDGDAQYASDQESFFKTLVGCLKTQYHKMKMVTITPRSKLSSEKPDDISNSVMISDTENGSKSQTASGPLHDSSRKTSSSDSSTEIHAETSGQFHNSSHRISQSYDDPVTPNASQQTVEDLFNGNNLFNIQNVNADNPTNPTNSAQGDKIIENRFKKLSLNKLFDGKVSVFHEGGDVELHCPCGKKFMGDTIQCRSCKTFQHSICFGLLNNKEPITHYCDQCALKYPESSETDLDLFGLDPTSKKELCLFRNALVLCTSARLMSLDNLIKNLQVSTKTAVDIIKEMEKSNLFYSTSIEPVDLTQPRLINHTVLSSSVLPHYFLNNPSRKEPIIPTPKLIPDVDNDIDDYLDATPNVLSQKEMEDDNPSYDGGECSTNTTFNERRSSKRTKKPVKRYANDPVIETRPKIRRKSSIVDSIKYQSDK